MSQPWKEEEKFLISVLEEYRDLIRDKDQKVAKQQTREFAAAVHKETPELIERTIESITQRLPYLDNLFAGVFKKDNYAIKDQHYYGTKPRQTRSIEPNLCNTRHAYKGAIR